MLLKLFLLFVFVPIIELALLLILADQTHWFVSLALVISTGALGAWLAKGQGLAALRRIRESMSNAQVPTGPLMDAALIFFAGGLLLTPGVLSDIFGISIMIPTCRAWYSRQLVAWFKRSFRVEVKSPFTGTDSKSADPNVVDSYVVDRDDNPADESPAAETDSGSHSASGFIK